MTTTILAAGTVFYHGTSTEEEFEDLIGPAWVTQSMEVAEKFAYRFAGEGENPRVLRYQLVTDLAVLEILGREDFYEILGDDTLLADSEELKDSLINSAYNGWTIPYNYKYPAGDDTLLRNPEDVLEFQQTTSYPTIRLSRV